MSSDHFPDGFVKQDGMRSHQRPENPSDKARYIPFPIKAQVQAVFAIDHVQNRNGEHTVCDCHCIEMGIDLPKVPVMLAKASVDNYIETRMVAATKNVDGSPFDALRPNPKVSNGDTVVIQFLYGDVHQPIIVGVMPHNQSGFDGVSPSPRGGEDAGDYLKARFNGTNFIIDKDGNVSFESTDALDKAVPPNKKFTVLWKAPGATQAVELEIDNTAGAPKIAATVTDAAGKQQKVLLDGAAKKIELTSQQASGQDHIEMDSTGISLLDKFANGVVMGSAGITLQDTNANHLIMDATGIKIVDKNGNEINLAAAGVDIDSAAKIINLDGSIYGLHEHIVTAPGMPTLPPVDANTE